MNRSEQIQEKLKCLSELEDLLSPLIIEEDKQVAIEGLSEVQERLKELVGKIEMLLQAKENYHDIIQKALRSREQDSSGRGDKLDEEDHKVESSRILQDEPPGSSHAMGMSLSSEVFYIRSDDHKSTGGYYESKPDEYTRFQISVYQSDPHVGILQLYDGIDEIEKVELIGGIPTVRLIESEGIGGLGSSQDTLENGKVSLNPELQVWKLITPITIKS